MRFYARNRRTGEVREIAADEYGAIVVDCAVRDEVYASGADLASVAEATAPCAECGHTRAEHCDPRWPCSVLACGCNGWKALL